MSFIDLHFLKENFDNQEIIFYIYNDKNHNNLTNKEILELKKKAYLKFYFKIYKLFFKKTKNFIIKKLL